MPKFSQVARGTRAIKPIKLPLVNTPGPYQPDLPELAAQRAKDGASERVEVDLGIRVLSPGEFDELLIRAREFAKQRNVETIDDRDPIYSLGYSLHLCAIACVDINPVDDQGKALPFDPADPPPFFGVKGNPDSAVEEMLKSPCLTRDSILYLAELQEAWQTEQAPQATRLGTEELWKLAGEVAASNDPSPFLRLRVGTQLQLLRFLVAHWWTAQSSSSSSDSTSAE